MNPEGSTEPAAPEMVPGAPEAPKKTPWGKIAAVVIVLIVIIAAVYLVVQRGNQAPTISQVTVSSKSAIAGDALQFTASASDPDGDTLTYTWNFGDNNTGTGATTPHTFAIPGKFIASVTVTDGKGGSATSNVSQLQIVDVFQTAAASRDPGACTSANCAPGPVVAFLTADNGVTQTGTAVNFNGNGSWAWAFSWNNATNHALGGSYSTATAASDPTLFTSLTYSWGDGSQSTVGTSNQVGVTSHTFATAGTYFVKLTALYTNTDLNPTTKTGSAGYTVWVATAAPPTTAKYPDVFTEATIGEPQYVDPAVDYETAGGEVLQNVYETLVWYVQGTESVTNLEGRLATTVPSLTNGGISTDGMTYNFTLRPNVQFHSGGTMTADDVIFSFSRVMQIHDPDGPAWILSQVMDDYADTYAGASTCATPPATKLCTVGDWVNDTYGGAWASVPARFQTALTGAGVVPANIATTVFTSAMGVAVIDSSMHKVNSTALQMYLSHPFPAFLSAIAFTVGSVVSQACVQAHGGVVWGTHNDFLDSQGDCGTGPFKFVTWEPNQVIILTRFDQYWRTLPAIREVHIAQAQDVTTREFMLRNGDADVVYVPRNHQYDVMNTDGTPKYSTLRIVKDKPTFNVDFLGYNRNINTAYTPDPWTEGANFFANIHVRKAFSYVFNYQNYITNVLYGGAQQLRGPIPQGMLGYNGSIPLFSYNLAAAKAELQQTPYWLGGFNITLYWNAGNAVREAAALLLQQGIQALQGQGAPNPFNVQLHALDWPVYLNTLQHRGLPVFFLGWAPDYADPSDYADPFLHTGGTFPNRIGYSNATLDGMIDAADRELVPSVRDKMYQDLASNAVLNDVPYLWLDQVTNFHVERTWVQGYYFNPMNSGLDFYTMSKA